MTIPAGMYHQAQACPRFRGGLCDRPRPGVSCILCCIFPTRCVIADGIPLSPREQRQPNFFALQGPDGKCRHACPGPEAAA